MQKWTNNVWTWCKGTGILGWFQEISQILVGVVATRGVICDRVKEEGLEGVVNGFWDFLDEPSGKAERSTALEMTKGISPCAALSRDDKQKRGVHHCRPRSSNNFMNHNYKPILSNIIQQFRCWSLLHFDIGKELFTCIFQAGPEQIYHIVDNQKPIVIMLADIDSNGWILLIMSLHI